MATPILSINNVMVTEGQDAVFTVSLSQASASTVSVNWTVSGFSGPDIGTVNPPLFNVLNFAAGETSKTITIKTVDNATIDPTAAIAVRLSGPNGALLGQPEGVATVLDNDAAAGTPVLTIRAPVVDEAAGKAIFTFVLDKPSAGTVSFDYTLQDGTAQVGSDFTVPLSPNSISFAPGELVKTLEVPIVNDTQAEGDETFGIVLASLVGATTPVSSASAVIAASDTLPVPTIRVEDVVAKETPVVAQQYAEFFVRLSSPSLNPVTVHYSTRDGTALAGADYAAKSGDITFSPGETFKTVQVPLLDDGTYEFNETFQLVLSSPVNGSLERSIGTVVLVDDDPNTPPSVYTPSVSVEDAVGSEGLGYADFIVRLNYPVYSKTVSVKYSTEDGTATAGSDYIATSDTLIFDPGETVKTVRVTLTDNASAEVTENFYLNLSFPNGAELGRPTGSATVIDNDAAPVSIPKLGVQDAAAGEGQGYVDFYVRLDAPTTDTVTVNYTTVNGSALAGSTGDYFAQVGTLNFAPGETLKTVRVAVVDDKVAEGTENFQLKLSAPVNATLAQDTATATLADNDAAAGTPNITVNSVTVEEWAGQAIFTVSLDKPSATAISVSYGTSDGTAKANSDYTSSSGILAFAPGEVAKTVAVPIIKDSVVESDEQFNLVLSNPSAGTLATSIGTATIKGDGTNTEPMLAIDNLVVNETDGFATFTVSLINPPASAPITFDYTTVDETAKVATDYIATTGSGFIQIGGASTTIQVPIIADAVTEDSESFSLRVSNIKANGISLPVSTLTGTATIRENSFTGGAVAVGDLLTTTQDRQATFSVLGNDIDPNSGTTGGLYVVFLNSSEVGETGSDEATRGQLTAVGVTDSETKAGGKVTIDSNGNGIYIPKAGYIGPDSFTYTLRDYPFNGFYHLSTATVNITVSDGTPKAGTDSSTTTSGKPVLINVLANDTDPNGDTLAVTAVTNGAHGTAVSSGGGNVIYTPAANYAGPDIFTYTVSDGTHTATGVVTIVVTDGRPIAVNDTASTAMNTVVAINVLANDSDPDGDLVATPAVSTAPTHGTAVVGAGGLITYTPATGYYGADSFGYTIRDALGHTTTATVSIAVANTGPGAPTASADSAITSQDRTVLISVLANDTDREGDILTLVSVTAPGNGTAVAGGNGIVTYTPKAGFFGVDSFTYTVSDGQGHSNVGLVSVTVASGAPVAVNDTASTNQDKPVTVPVLVNDTDPQGDLLSVTAVGSPANGTVVINGGGSITYTPAAGYVGLDRFTYTVSDGLHTSDGMVSISVDSGTPVAVDDSAATGQGKAVSIAVLANDSDPQGDTLSVAGVTNPLYGTAVIAGNGRITYTPIASFIGTDSFNYTLSDGHGHTATGSVSVTVATGTPVAEDDTATTSPGKAVAIAVLANDSDPDNDPLSVTKVTAPAYGTAVIDGNGIVTYTPKSNFAGTDGFAYTVSDGQGYSATGFVTVSVQSDSGSQVNTPPTLVNPIPDQSAAPNQFFRYTVPYSVFTDSDAGDFLSYRARAADGTALPSWLQFDPASQVFSGTPSSADAGALDIKVTATDQSFASVSDIFRLTVTASTGIATPGKGSSSASDAASAILGATGDTNHAPTTADRAVAVSEAGARVFKAADFPFADADEGNSLQSVAIGSLPLEGQLQLSGQAVQAGQTIARADIDAGHLVYLAPTTVQGEWAQQFGFKVSDGKAVSVGSGLMTLDITLPGSAKSGTGDADTISGRAKADLLIGNGGNDVLDGKGGADRLYGGDGADTLKGGNGNDLLSGGSGNDRLLGGGGRDILIGGAGDDFMDGGAGKDVYRYLANRLGADDLQAGSHDTIRATQGDRIEFDAGLWARLTKDGISLGGLAGQDLGGTIDSDTNIAFDSASRTIQIDVNGDGVFQAGQDVAIEILGQAQVGVDTAGNFLVLG